MKLGYVGKKLKIQFLRTSLKTRIEGDGMETISAYKKRDLLAGDEQPTSGNIYVDFAIIKKKQMVLKWQGESEAW